MNKFWLVLTIVFLLFSACEAQTKGQKFNWKEVVPVEGKFKATFPASPTKSIQEIVEGTEKAQLTFLKVSLIEPGITFSVSYADILHMPAMNQDDLKTFYKDHQDGFSKIPIAKIMSARDVFVDGKLGLEMVLNYDDYGAVHTSRTYLIGKRLFQLGVTTKLSLMKDVEIKKGVDKFLDSFKTIEN